MAVRPIRPDDAERIVAFHERQSPESIYFRFFSPRPRLSERDLERFTQVDYVDRMAFVGLIGDDLVGVARYDRHRARSDAEVAFFIDDAHHGRGMATVLLEYLAAAAREAGISGFTASVLPQNRKMLGVFTQAGFTASSRFEDGVIEVQLDIEPTPEALAAIEDRAGQAEARSVERLLRPTSIAVIGASQRPGTIGHQVFHQLVSRGFQGPVYPINRGGRLRGQRPGLAVGARRPRRAGPGRHLRPGRPRCCGWPRSARSSGCRGWSCSPPGSPTATRRARRPRSSWCPTPAATACGCSGPTRSASSTPTRPSRCTPRSCPSTRSPGRIGLVAQSGVIGAAIIDAARQVGLGHLLVRGRRQQGRRVQQRPPPLLAGRPGHRRGHVLPGVVRQPVEVQPHRPGRCRSDKPVVAVKVGGSPADRWEEPEGWPPDATAAALLEQTGIVRVDNLTQMFHTAGVLANQPLPAGNRVAVLTNSWGPAWLAVDALEGGRPRARRAGRPVQRGRAGAVHRGARRHLPLGRRRRRARDLRPGHPAATTGGSAPPSARPPRARAR